MKALLQLLGLGGTPFNDWRFVSAARLPRPALTAMVLAAIVALALSAFTVIRARRAHAPALIALRALALATCLAIALQPALELRQIMRVPNRVAVLVDGSRSMEVTPPEGGPSRAARAAALLTGAQSARADWEREGHRVDVYTFGEGLIPTTLEGLRAAPAADATRIGEALGELSARTSGHDLGAVVIISDGVDTGRIGKGPLDAETRAAVAAFDAPVHTVGIGEPALRDLSVAAVMADEFAFVRTPVTIEAVVRQSGLPDRSVDVTLTRDGRPVAAQTVALAGASSEQKVSFNWVPDHPGTYVFKVSTPVLVGEALASNNAQIFTVKVLRDRVRVLHVCGRPSWDERFLRAMLRRDPNVDLVSFFILRTETDEQPFNRNDMSLIPFPTYEIFEDQLHSFDLVIFQNFNYAPYGVEPFLPGLRDYVDQGGALAMIGGDLSFASGHYGDTPLQDVLPVELGRGEGAFTTDAFKPKLTPEGRAHPITSLLLDQHENELRWGKLPPLEGVNQVLRLRPGAVPLLVHPTLKVDGKPAPVLAVGEPGKGRVLALLTDTTWHWGFLAAGEGDDGRAFQHFWENAIRWLVHDPALTLLRVEFDRAEYRRHQSPAVRVRAMHPDYTAAPGVKIEATVTAADATEQPGATTPPGAGDRGQREPAGAPLRRFEVTTDGEGDGHVDVGPLPPGAYRLNARATLDGRPVTESRTFVVRAEGKELEDVIFRDEVLKEIADAGGGSYRFASLDGVTIRDPQEVRVGARREVAVWSNPALLLLAVALLAVEWVVRRRAGYR